VIVGSLRNSFYQVPVLYSAPSGAFPKVLPRVVQNLGENIDYSQNIGTPVLKPCSERNSQMARDLVKPFS